MKNIPTGEDIYNLARDLFPINRSITGDGVRITLAKIKDLVPQLSIHEVPTGQKVFDWEIPEEWNVSEAWVKDPQGFKIIDLAKSNLHLVGYSAPIHEKMDLNKLNDHLHSLPEQTEAVPYVTSYYSRNWGFCLRHKDRVKLQEGIYEVFIDSAFKKGSLTYGEVILPGHSREEILLSTYICHPSMANNEVSGPCVATYLARWLSSLSKRRYTYRIVFIPETIGAIAYLHRNLKTMQNNTIAGFVLTCVGDDRCYSFLPSRNGDTMADRVAKHVLKHRDPQFKSYSFLDRGSDERQYCAPGIDLPVASIMRSKYMEYPEYHTSLDDLNLISPSGLLGGFEANRKALEILEQNVNPESLILCEPQMGKRGLRSVLTNKHSFGADQRLLMNFWTYCDGKRSILDIAELLGVAFDKLLPLYQLLKENKIVKVR